MRAESSVLHLDLDAFYASVEQRDKPSLRGKPVIVGGTGQRGVVATASYEARRYGVRSAMPTHEARRRCPHAAFLSGRFDAYREASQQVMGLLHRISPRVEPLSLDEAFVDLATTEPENPFGPVIFDTSALTELVVAIKAELAAVTGGLTCSIGIASSKFMAKVATELDKPDGLFIVEPGTEVELLRPMQVTVIPGVGPVTTEKLRRIGISTVADLQAIPPDELIREVGRAHGTGLLELAYARDDRPVEPEREAKSISVEDTFATDLVDHDQLGEILVGHAAQVGRRLRAAQLFARTVTIKVRQHDFTTQTRARTLATATDRTETITTIARSLLTQIDTSNGIRLLGVGVAGLTDVVQEDLFGDDPAITGAPATEQNPVDDHAPAETASPDTAGVRPRFSTGWHPGQDVRHDDHGQGWVWGTGLGRVTVRFETRDTGPGPVRTFATDDPALQPLR
ncbi:DNA polymerase IV [Microlunatus speluncae]|uniref:DNA polymerase IV n=1 Tax=Microlunatus speluncae TaxID=2594267 RepID=UPI00126613B8|nr:DNA polymerase IV [Microlunatus speluncae]